MKKRKRVYDISSFWNRPKYQRHFLVLCPYPCSQKEMRRLFTCVLCGCMAHNVLISNPLFEYFLLFRTNDISPKSHRRIKKKGQEKVLVGLLFTSLGLYVDWALESMSGGKYRWGVAMADVFVRASLNVAEFILQQRKILFLRFQVFFLCSSLW